MVLFDHLDVIKGLLKILSKNVFFILKPWNVNLKKKDFRISSNDYMIEILMKLIF